MKKSITIIGNPVEYVYIIKDIDIDKITIEKYSVDCRSPIETAWGLNKNQNQMIPSKDEQIIILKEKINNVTLFGKASVIEMAAKLGGKIVKDFSVERAKRGKRVYISDIELFKEVLK